MQRFHLELATRTMRLGIQSADQPPAMEDWEGEVSVPSLWCGRVALDPVVESEQFEGARPIPDYGVERRQHGGDRGPQGAGCGRLEIRGVVWMHIEAATQAVDLDG
jgi:hypothetical protein